MKKRIEFIMAICLILSAFILARQGAVLVQSNRTDGRPEKTPADKKEKICIVIDAGHGEADRRPKEFGMEKG